MSEVNRFMSPVKDQFQQTYVDQYIPMPFEIMQKRAEKEQKKYDTVQNNWDTLRMKIGEKVHSADNPIMSEKMEELQSKIQNTLQEVDGDWRQLDRTVVDAAGDYNKFIKVGEGAMATTNLAKINETHKLVDESDMDGLTKALTNQYIENKYTSEGGVRGGAKIYNPILFNAEPLQEKVATLISKATGSEYSTVKSAINEKKGLIYDGHSDIETLSKDRVRTIANSMKADPDFQAMVESQYQVGYPGSENMTKKQFADYRFAQMFGFTDAYAYSKAENRLSIKEAQSRKEAAKKEAQDVPLKPVISMASTVDLKPTGELFDEEGNVKSGDLYNNLLAANKIAGKKVVTEGVAFNFFKDNKKYSGMTNDVVKQKFTQKIGSWLEERGFYIDKEKLGEDGKPLYYNQDGTYKAIPDQVQNDLVKYAAKADNIDGIASLFDGNITQARAFQAKAKETYKEIERNKLLMEQAENDALRQGKFANNNTILTAKKQNAEDKELLGQMASAYVTKKLKDIFDQDALIEVSTKIRDGDVNWFVGNANLKNTNAKKILSAIETYNDPEDRASETDKEVLEMFKDQDFINLATQYDKADKSFQEVYNQRKKSANYRDILNNNLRESAGSAKGSVALTESPTLSFTTQSEIQKKQQALQQGQQYTPKKIQYSAEELYDSFLLPQLPKLKEMDLKTSTGEPVKLKNLVGGMFSKTTNPLKQQNDYIKEAFKSARFSEDKNPNTGNTEIVFNVNGKEIRLPYVIGGKGDENTIGINNDNDKFVYTADQQIEMEVQNQIYNARKSALSRTYIGSPEDGVFIETKKGDAINKFEKNFDYNFSEGGKYRVSVNPQSLGLYFPIEGEPNKTQNNFIIPNEQASDFLKNYNLLLNGTARNNWLVSFPSDTNLSNKEMARKWARLKLQTYYKEETGNTYNPNIPVTGGMGVNAGANRYVTTP